MLIGGNKRPTEAPQPVINPNAQSETHSQPQNENEEQKTIENKPKVTISFEQVDSFIKENLKKLSEHIAQGARGNAILPESELERTYAEYLASDTNKKTLIDWDFTHKILEQATGYDEEAMAIKTSILRKLSEHNKNAAFHTYASLDLVVPGTKSDLQDEYDIWRSLLKMGTVVIGYNRPGIFSIGALTAWHLQLSSFMLTKLWEGSKEGSPKPFISGFNLPYPAWRKIYTEQKSIVG